MKTNRLPCIACGCALAIADIAAAQMVTYHIATTVQAIDPQAPGFPASLAGVSVGAPLTVTIRYDAASPPVSNPPGGVYGLATRYNLLSASLSCTIGGVDFANLSGTPTAFVWNNDPILGTSTLSDGLIFTNVTFAGSTQIQLGNLLLPNGTFAAETLPTTSVAGMFVMELRQAGSLATWVSASWTGLPLAPTASYTVFGPGCSGSLGVPGNTAITLPRLGQTMQLRFNNLPQNAAIFVLGWSNTTSGLGPLPLDLAAYGASGCLARVSFDQTRLLLGIVGSADHSLSIPNQPSYLGLPFFTQALVLDPGRNALGAVTSAAAAAVIGV